MKKIISIALVVLCLSLVFVLFTACGNKTDDTTTTTTVSTTVSADDSTEEETTEVVTDKNGAVVDKFFDSNIALILDGFDNEIGIYQIYDKNNEKVKPYKIF